MRFLLIMFFILFAFLSHSQDRPINFVFYKLEKYKNSGDTVFLKKINNDKAEQMFFYVKIAKNKWRGINEEGIVEIGQFKRKFNFITPWWNIFSNPIQMKKVRIWEYHFHDSIEYVNYGRNNGCCHTLYKSNDIHE